MEQLQFSKEEVINSHWGYREYNIVKFNENHNSKMNILKTLKKKCFFHQDNVILMHFIALMDYDIQKQKKQKKRVTFSL